MEYILTLDQGTTTSRAILFDCEGRICKTVQYPFPQLFPQPGWVEHNPVDILDSQCRAMMEAASVVPVEDIKAIGIANQRETTVVWNKHTGCPICNAIVWQCRRTAPICEELRAQGWQSYILEKTGLVLDAYFSATKIKWILDTVEGARELAEEGSLLFGTVDTWLLWNLTGIHATDYTNASRTMLYDIHRMCWDEKILRVLNIPRSMLPEVKDTAGIFGYAKIGERAVPVASMVGDQQAALFGQVCFDAGEAKNTYGTGCFILVNAGEKCPQPKGGLISTIAWGINGKITYAIEGSVFNAGTVIQWMRDGLGIIERADQCDGIASTVRDSGGVYFVPAFTGLGAPHWDMYARGAMVGLTRGTGKPHIVRAALEGIAYQCKDIFNILEQLGIHLKELRADGGASASEVLLQFQADILGVPVNRPLSTESTALGAAYLAGLAVGVWADFHQLSALRKVDHVFLPQIAPDQRIRLYEDWQRAVQRAKDWEKEECTI